MNIAYLVANASEQAQASGGATMIVGVIYLVAIVGFMYFVMIRPQSKQEKERMEIVNSVEVGDSVLTTGGFYGVVIDVSEDMVIVEFGSNKNCRIPMQKKAIVEVEKPENK
ncbi:MAG: preprotein translocase subunit YajC [Lachnospiraceae bacterium]|nr:preprotein translocase subunit YajC [Lachnospiraceae bacterium]